MAAEARAGAGRLRAAGARTGAVAGPAIRPSLRGALGAEEAALATHVKGLGLGPLDLRPLNSDPRRHQRAARGAAARAARPRPGAGRAAGGAVTRREALLAALGAALAAAPADARRTPISPSRRDSSARERAAARAYAKSSAVPHALRLAAQDAKHARVLATHVEAYGAQSPPDNAPLDPQAARVAAATHRAAARHAALALEADLISTYEDALKMLAEAQHRHDRRPRAGLARPAARPTGERLGRRD